MCNNIRMDMFPNESGPSGVHVWLILLKASQAIHKRLAAGLQSSGLCDSDFRVLELLLHKGAMPVNAIGPKVNLTPGSISVAVDRLHARGLVSRVESAEDRRVRLVDLTEAGRALIEPVFAQHSAQLEEVMGPLSAEDRVMLESLLKTVGRHAEAHGTVA